MCCFFFFEGGQEGEGEGKAVPCEVQGGLFPGFQEEARSMGPLLARGGCGRQHRLEEPLDPRRFFMEKARPTSSTRKKTKAQHLRHATA
eukprot:6366872-Pyramimonas_sp.AAC.1